MCHRQPYQRVLAGGQTITTLAATSHVTHRLVDKRARRPIGSFGLRELALKGLAGGKCSRPPDFASDVCRELVEHAPAYAAGPCRVTHDREADHADLVETPTALGRLGECRMRIALGHEDGIDPVVYAPRGSQPKDIPV